MTKLSRKTRQGFGGASVNFRPPAVDIYAHEEVLVLNATVLENCKQIHPLENTILNSEIMIPDMENAFKVIGTGDIILIKQTKFLQNKGQIGAKT